MKKSLCLSLLVLSQWASGESLQITSLHAPLTNFDLDDRQFHKPVQKASVEIHLENEQVSIVIHEQNNCQVATDNNMPCVMLRPSDRTITLPLISKEKDSCGVTTWIAAQDARPQDGPRQTIEITDYSKISCRVYVPQDEMTQIRYTYLIESRKVQNFFTSTFAGSKLTPAL